MILGHPFHGLVAGGVLSLPNGSTMSYPQPTGGDCRVLRVPGVPAMSRTTAEAAADIAAGRQWLDYALISGTDGLLYGQPIGANSWIYATSSARYLIQGSGGAFSYRLFGALGLSDAWHTAALSGSTDALAALSGASLWGTSADGSSGVFTAPGGEWFRVSVALADGILSLSVTDFSTFPPVWSSAITSDPRVTGLPLWGIADTQVAGWWDSSRPIVVTRSRLITSDFSAVWAGEEVKVNPHPESPGYAGYVIYDNAICTFTGTGSVSVSIGDGASLIANSSGTVSFSYTVVRLRLVKELYAPAFGLPITPIYTDIRSINPGPISEPLDPTSVSIVFPGASVLWSDVFGSSVAPAAPLAGCLVGLLYPGGKYGPIASVYGGTDRSWAVSGSAQYHSAHPVTRQIVRNQSTPVCWV